MLKYFQLTSLEEKGKGIIREFVINTQNIVSFEFLDDKDDAIITLVTGEKFYLPCYESSISPNSKKDYGTWDYVSKEIW